MAEINEAPENCKPSGTLNPSELIDESDDEDLDDVTEEEDAETELVLGTSTDAAKVISKKMGKRRSGRELAFRLLFQIDVGGGTPEEVFAAARVASESTPEVWVFAAQVARGAWEARREIDPIIEKYAAGWTLDRMANADRNLLRIAIYEILHREDIPRSVSINEAVELSKRYSTADSAKFINGILGSFAREQGD